MGDEVFEKKPATTAKEVVPAAAAGVEPKVVEIDESLKPFVGEDGKLDASKLSQSYLELQKKHTQTAQEKSAIERAYQMIARNPSPAVAPTAPDASAGRISLEDMVADPAAVIHAEAGKAVEAGTAPIVQAVLEIAHPEVAVDPATGTWKNPDFVNGLQKYAATLPAHIRANVDKDLTTANWVINNYKRLVAAAPGAAGKVVAPAAKVPAQELESASISQRKPGDKRFTKQEIDALMRKPKEYAKVADEITKAYEEGRVES